MRHMVEKPKVDKYLLVTLRIGANRPLRSGITFYSFYNYVLIISYYDKKIFPTGRKDIRLCGEGGLEKETPS